MAGVLGRIRRVANISKNGFNHVKNKFSTISLNEVSTSKKILYGTVGLVGGGGVVLLIGLERSVSASDLELHPAKLPWVWNGLFNSFDHASIRRGYEVYKQVCAACHSMRFVRYRELIGVSHTEEEAKKEAEEIMVTDGPDETGEMFQRPGKLSDRFPNPYPNEEAARHANNGAFPPDLSYITSARHGGADYVFALLTGYCDAPGGIKLQDGQYFNPYFPGGAISMAQAIYNEVLEYEDGTPAYASQITKDICAFLKWSAEPEHDTRKEIAMKALIFFPFVFAIAYYLKKHKWSTMKTRKIAFKPRNPPQ